jgi:DNA (cytosine-5)-methyltransferase 1
MRQGYFTIGQASETLGRSISTLRRWHQSGRMIPDLVDQVTGYRLYSAAQLADFARTNWLTPKAAPPIQRSFFTFIDLFAGIGGIRIPFEELGGICVFTSEIDRYACKTYAANFHEQPVGDITKIDGAAIPRHDVLLGGFPCQPFSISGVSKYRSLGRDHGFLDQTKGTLFFDIVRILRHHQPKAFLLENVKNLRSHDTGNTWRVIKGTLEQELGYTVYDQIIDARLLVPQHRERIFIVGFRDPVPFTFPTIPDEKPLVRAILEIEVDPKYTLTDHLWGYLQTYAEKHRDKGNGFGYGLANLDGISRTLSARYYKDGSEILIPQEGKSPRRLTPRECARLMGFPEEFTIPVSDTQAYKQFGNAVVVPLVRVVAGAMIGALQRYEQRPAALVPAVMAVA